jgi:hypothetical protein
MVVEDAYSTTPMSGPVLTGHLGLTNFAARGWASESPEPVNFNREMSSQMGGVQPDRSVLSEGFAAVLEELMLASPSKYKSAVTRYTSLASMEGFGFYDSQ